MKKQTRKDPLHQFSALPPPALRTSQVAFESAIRSALEIAGVVGRLNEIEERIRIAREARVMQEVG